MRRLLALALTALAAVSALTGLPAAPAAWAVDADDFTALAAQAAALSQDRPAPASWRTQEADTSGTSSPTAWPRQATGREAWFGRSWYDTDGNGCDTRNDILQRDLTGTRLKGGSDCTVVSGVLEDPYTGDTVRFTRGRSTSSAVQVDHVVPLGFAYAHGAWAWDADTRLSFANDPLNLLAVSGAANAAKSDSGPRTSPTGSGSSYDVAGGDGWVPPDEGYSCAYAARFTQVAASYRLGLGQEDAAWLSSTLQDCAAGPASSTSIPPTGDQVVIPEWVRDTAHRVESWAADHPLATLGAGACLVAVVAGTQRRGR